VKSISILILMFSIGTYSHIQTGTGVLSQDKKDLAAFEKEMAERPQEALSIARRAAPAFADDEKQLYRWALVHQEKHLPDLSLNQVVELAEAAEKKLDDSQASRRVRINWLLARAAGLSQDEVRRLIGSPQRSSFQFVYSRQLEQWTYDQPAPAWLTFSCTKGQVPRLQSVQTTFR
jgi:hypothetical protein